MTYTTAQAEAAKLEMARLRREILAGLGRLSTQSYQLKRLRMVNDAVKMAIAYKAKS